MVLLIGLSASHLGLLQVLDKIAPTHAEILISGPSGVGKELYARYAHDKSARARAPFVPVNCGAVPETLFENEMFGHAAGAFTGANQHRHGLVGEAEGGSLFLDEVDALSPANQVKLLRFLQSKEYRRLGECRLRHADVRIVAAANQDLVAAVAAGRFREDLFYRLRVAPVEVPPLRDRPDDVPPLLEAYTAQFAAEYALPEIELAGETRAKLLSYPWPGNVRELVNCVQYLTCLQLGRPVRPEDLRLLPGHDAAPRPEPERLSFREAKREIVDDFERYYLSDALARNGGNIARAARDSGKPRRAFFELMRKHRLDAAEFR